MSALDGGTVTIYSVCAAAILFCFVGMAVSCEKSKQEAQTIAARGCTLVAKEETGNRVYCGKACFRPEIRRIYQCKDGALTLVD